MSDENNSSSSLSGRQLGSCILPIAVGTAAVLAFPPLLSVIGFKAGIGAGTLAAKQMSISAIANGGGVASGGAVAIAQSIGAAGLSTTASVGIGTGVAAITVGVQKISGSIGTTQPDTNKPNSSSKGNQSNNSYTDGVRSIGSKVVEMSSSGISATGSGIKSAGGYIVGMVDNETVRSGVSATAKGLQKVGGKVVGLTLSSSAAVGSGVVSVAGGVKRLVVGENGEKKNK